jgi:hypothetical protein
MKAPGYQLSWRGSPGGSDSCLLTGVAPRPGPELRWAELSRRVFLRGRHLELEAAAAEAAVVDALFDAVGVSTIHRMISAHPCADATGPGVAGYPDLTRVRHGGYRLTNAP